jgi:large subunit ribosomal protein L24
MKIQKNDQVLIIRGKDKGKKGKVLRGLPKKAQILVENINIKKVRKKPKKSGEKGQTVEIAFPIYASNVKLICPKCGKPVKIGYSKTKDKTKVRVCKKCGAEL